MSSPPLAIVPILAMPFAVTSLPGAAVLNPALATLFAARIRKGDTAPGSNALCQQGRDDLFESPDPPVSQLAAEIYAGVNSVVDAVNNFPCETLPGLRRETRGWFTVIEQDGCVPAASHRLTTWCAIYCVAAPPPSGTRRDSGILRLYEYRLGTAFQDATNSAMRLPYLTGHYGWRPVAGHMAVFPASVTHEVATLRTPGPLILVTVRVRFIAPGQLGFGRW